MPSQPKVDILLATYNGEKYLKAQIDSILNQSSQDFRILVRDDGSTDSTMKILGAYKIKYPQKIVLLANKNAAPGVIRNFSTLIEESSAPYLMFADQDDVWFPEKIKKLVDQMEIIERKSPPQIPVLVHSDLTVVDSKLSVLDSSFMSYSGLNPERISTNNLLIQNVITGCSAMFNRSLANMAVPIPPEAMMHDWWLALVACCTGKIEYLKEPTGYYRQHGSNTLGVESFNLVYIWEKFKITVFRKQGDILAGNIHQAKALLEKLGDILGKETRSMVEGLISLEEKKFLPKRKIMLKNRFFKGRLSQNIGLFIKA